VFTNLSTAIEIDDRGISYEATLCIFNGTEGAYAKALRAVHFQVSPPPAPSRPLSPDTVSGDKSHVGIARVTLHCPIH
jgi:hypothetical protein